MAHGMLIPTDGSALATRVLPYAALLAKQFDAEVAVVQAVELDLTPSFSYTTGRWEHAGRAVERGLADAQAELKAVRDELVLQGVSAESLVQPGSPASVVLEEVRHRHTSLVVMATHGRTGVSRYALGSVAEQVLRKAQVPVLLLTPRALDAGPPERLLRRLLVPLDGSDLSASILPAAGALAERLAAPVTLVRAVDSPDELESAAAELRTTLAALQRGGGAAPGAANEVFVQVGAPADVITRCAAESEAGWIAMASHGRGGLGGLVLGSIALTVLRQADVPLLVAAQPQAGPYRLGATPD